MQMEQSRPRAVDRLLFVFSVISMIVLLGRGIYLVVAAILDYDPQETLALASSILDALGMLVCTLLVLPMALMSLWSLRGRAIPAVRIPPIKIWQGLLLFAAWVFVVVLAGVLTLLPDWGWLIAAPLFLIGILLPVAGLSWIAASGLLTGSWRRPWSALGLGMTGGAFLAVALEYLLVGIGAVIAVLVLLGHPEWVEMLKQLRNQITQMEDIEAQVKLLAPYLANPWALVVLLLVAAGFVPLIEESLKPLAVWLLGKRLRSPGEGFVLGALGGAGFALLEGFMSASASGLMVGFSLVGRAAASMMHILASGVLGWGIASAFLRRRYGHLAAAWLTSLALHGLWNGSAVLAAYGALRFLLQPASPDILGVFLILLGVGGLGLMLMVVMTTLPLLNVLLRSKETPSSPVSEGAASAEGDGIIALPHHPNEMAARGE